MAKSTDTITPHITHACADDWEGWYLNGKLLDEGHHISPEKLIVLLFDNGLMQNVTLDKVFANQEWIEFQGDFPDSFSDFVSEGQEWTGDDNE